MCAMCNLGFVGETCEPIPECTCPNGTPAQYPECAINGELKCASCIDDGFVGENCEVRPECTCPHGIAAVYPECATSGVLCATVLRAECDEGWTGDQCQFCADGYTGENCDIACVPGETIQDTCMCGDTIRDSGVCELPSWTPGKLGLLIAL